MIRAFLALVFAVAATAAQAAPRIEAVDGDTVLVDGVSWRLLGFDAPEIERAWCEAEYRLGVLAKQRLDALLRARTPALTSSGRSDRYGRILGTLTIDARDVAEIMISEGYARPYGGARRKGWCSRDSRDDMVPPAPRPAQ